MKQRSKKLWSVLLSLALLLSLVPAMALTASAVSQTPVSYLDCDGTALVERTGENGCKVYTVVSDTNIAWTTGWYVVDSDVTISHTVTVSGDVHLILCDKASLTVNGGENKAIDAADGSTLTIYAQSEGSSAGALTAYSTGADAIGGQTLTINGGTVTATGSNNVINVKGDVTINSGEVSAYAIGNDADGINAGGNVRINGGKVTAKRTGAAKNSGICATFDITINGGAVVESSGFNHGLYSGQGAVTIDGGTVTAIGANAGICANEKHGVIIKADSTVTASGEQRAIAYASGGYNDTPVKNAIAGVGWTNTEGTAGQTRIAVNTGGQNLSTYKKVQFVAPHTHTDGEKTITFIPWTRKNSLPTTAGNYYLTADVTLTNTWTVPANTVRLCLNGHGIRMNAEKRVIYIGGNTLELYDCNSERVHYVTLTNWRGTAVSDTGTERAVTDVGNGVVKVNGGYITGGYAKETGYTEGGCIYIGASGTFTMHGGTILGNKADGLGGGIWSGGTLNIGGTSRVNYNSGSGQNSGVYLAAMAAKFTISGKPDLTGNKGRDIVFNNNTYNAGTRINFTPFNPNVRLGRVYIQTYLTGVITSNADFTNDDELKAVMQPIDVGSVFRVNADHQAQIVHVHSFTYAAGEGENANRITVICSNNGCVLPLIDGKRTATLTIAAPAHTVYGDGKDPEAVITDTYNIQGDAVVSYYAVQGDAKTGKALSKAPTDAGRYWAEITLGSATAHVVYTISPAPIYIDVNPATYKVSLPAETEGGKLTASRATAPKGATVTITAAPDEGYQAVKPTVTDKDGKSVELKDNGNDTWSFLMPGSDVTVKGSFEKTEPAKPEGKEKFVDVPADAWYHDDVYWAVEKGITLGVDDTHFAPDADCTRGQFVTFLWRTAGQPVSNSAANPFVDVKAGDYYYDAVLWAVEKGITKGTDDTHFDPDKPVTRAQAITFLYRYEQSEGRGFTGLWAFRLDYSDAEQVPDWAYEAFCWMVKENICKGSDGKLEPDALCPRCQVVALLARIFNT